MSKSIAATTFTVILIVAAVTCSAATRVIDMSLDLMPLFVGAQIQDMKCSPLPSVEDTIRIFSMEDTELVTDKRGLPAISGVPVLKGCAIPGSTGAFENVARLVILEKEGAAASSMQGLLYEQTGYCTLDRLAADMATIVNKAEQLAGGADDYDAVLWRIIKALTVVHYDWYMLGMKDARTMAMDGFLPYTVVADPERLAVRVYWPALIDGAECSASYAESHTRISTQDPEGLKAVMAADFNLMILKHEIEMRQTQGAPPPST